MARITDEEVQRLEAQQKRVTEKLKRLKHQQQYQFRKDETRRKIITGGAVLAAVRDGMVADAFLARVLDAHITKKNEREFMGLKSEEAPKDEDAQEVSNEQSSET